MGVHLSQTIRGELEDIVRHQRGEARLYRRARMVLLAAEGESVSEIARRLGTNRLRVGQWLRRFRERGVEGLEDLERSGRPVEITSLERHQVIAAACKSPGEYGLQQTVWTHAALREALISKRLVREISTSEIGRILDEAEIKPHRIRRWCHSEDPQFQERMRAIVRLYVKRPHRQPVLCIDEKTGMQVLSRSRPLQLPGPGQGRRLEFEYRRHGTRCLFACFNVGTGKVLARCTETRKRSDFFSFMDEVASVYRQRRVHVVLDNLNTHRDTGRGPFVTDWNRRHGNRFVFHYTPTHGSWLNQVELWFSILTRRILRYGDFRSAGALIRAIDTFVRRWNRRDAHPFRWTCEGLPLVK
jgi:transposase